MLDKLLFLPVLLVGDDLLVPVLGGGDLVLASPVERGGTIKPLLLLHLELFLLLVVGDGDDDDVLFLLVLLVDGDDASDAVNASSGLLSSLTLFSLSCELVDDDVVTVGVGDDEDSFNKTDTGDKLLVLLVFDDCDNNSCSFFPEDDGEFLEKCFPCDEDDIVLSQFQKSRVGWAKTGGSVDGLVAPLLSTWIFLTSGLSK